MIGRKPEGSTEGSKARRWTIIAAVLVALFFAALIIPLYATSTPYYFSRYHLLNRRYVNLEDSAHEGIGCRSCHETDALQNGLQLTADYYSSLYAGVAERFVEEEDQKRQEKPRFFQFGPPDNDACVKCHGDEWSHDAKRTERIPHPAHSRVSEETRPCVECHKWTAHLETYMEKHKTMPFSGVCVTYGCHVGTKQSDQCFDCHHILHNDAAQWTTRHPATVKKTGQNACMESCHQVAQCQQCHTTGEVPEFEGQTVQVGMEAIEQLHVRDDWTQRFHGDEAMKDRAKCLLCHQSSGECDECHRDRPAFHGDDVTAWIGRHAKQSASVVDPRCIECHEKQWCADCHDQFKEME